jgi:hypothetical protein
LEDAAASIGTLVTGGSVVVLRPMKKLATQASEIATPLRSALGAFMRTLTAPLGKISSPEGRTGGSLETTPRP